MWTVAVWGALLGCTDTPEPSVPGVIVVSLDSVRWDHTSLSGYEHDTTPSLSRLAAMPGAVTYEAAYTAASWSLPAYASIFSGQRAVTHGVGFTREALAPLTRTLPEVLAAHGYTTRAWCSGPHLLSTQGMDRGFSAYHHEKPFVSLSVAVSRFLQELPSSEAPLFAFVQGYDAHFPYPSPTAIAGMFAPELEQEVGTCQDFCDTHRAGASWRCVDRSALELDITSPPLEEHRHILSHYDSAVFFADYQLGRLLDGLEAAGRLDDFIIVALSDHGEGLGDSGRYSHDWECTEAAFQVPMVIRVPADWPARRWPGVVSLDGLTPTLLELLQITPLADADGRDFARTLSAEEAAAPDPDALAVTASRSCYSVRSAGWRFSEQRLGGDWSRLQTSLRRDGVGTDQGAQHPDIAATLAAEIAGWPRDLDLDVRNSRAADDEEVRRLLQQGGYWRAPPEGP